MPPRKKTRSSQTDEDTVALVLSSSQLVYAIVFLLVCGALLFLAGMLAMQYNTTVATDPDGFGTEVTSRRDRDTTAPDSTRGVGTQVSPLPPDRTTPVSTTPAPGTSGRVSDVPAPPPPGQAAEQPPVEEQRVPPAGTGTAVTAEIDASDLPKEPMTAEPTTTTTPAVAPVSKQPVVEEPKQPEAPKEPSRPKDNSEEVAKKPYTVQIASFSAKDRVKQAEAFKKEQLKKNKLKVELITSPDGKLVRAVVGAYATHKEASAAKADLTKRGFKGCWVKSRTSKK